MNDNVKKEIVEWLKSILIALVIVLPISMLAAPKLVKGESMEPTLNNHDVVLTEKISLYKNELSRGEIIVFDARPYEKELYIKRIIGLPGDTVEIRDGLVYVNGNRLSEGYLKTNTYTSMDMKVVVPEDKIFVLGDNREVSNDSRFIGPIEIKKIKGHAVYRLFPFNKINKIVTTK
jgi:signal peptidase I